ncbi:Membrane transport protein [Jeotgalicoccus saudimassiliensis]|uniref:Membrane transport protein n=1 Tax=Jeotgalicoccus saudimassiliensis TaxID=1461582 RepID=A0A078M9R2_9STAP|nr:AEC family transporter [Jeotgalicoccus saudimassiliensis]CEA03070.1 Membrane transport protein [Jeotgalicoccus saudimassiliensis]
MLSLLMIVVPVFLVFVIGFTAQKLLKMDIKSVSSVSLYILFPCLAFTTFYTNPLDGEFLYALFYSVILMLTLTLVTIVIASVLKYSRAEIGAMLLGVLFPNSGNYGAPVVLFAINAAAFDYAIMLTVIHTFIISTVGIFIASYGNGAAITVREGIRSVMRVPVIYAVMIAVIMQLLNFDIPPQFMEVIEMIGAASIPIVMLILGMQLADMKLGHSKITEVTGLVVMRMVVSPLIAMVLTLFMPIDEIFKLVFIILNAMPVAANATMIAAAYNTKPDTVSLGAFVTTVLSLIALPVWLYVLGIGM